MKKAHFLILIIIISLDQLSKWLSDPIKNSGSFLNLFNLSNRSLIFMGLVLVVILFVVYFRSRQRFLEIGLILVISGIVSNSIDRLFLGYVRDFINPGFQIVFNLADISIIIGCVVVIINQMRRKND